MLFRRFRPVWNWNPWAARGWPSRGTAAPPMESEDHPVMKLTAAARSDVGRRRPANEDTYALAPELGLFLVADGMGGHRAGQVASGLAARAAVGTLRSLGGDSRGPSERLRSCVAAANGEILASSRIKPELAGMGTTV